MSTASSLRNVAAATRICIVLMLICCSTGCNPVQNLYTKYNKRTFTLLSDGRYVEALAASLDALRYVEMAFGADSVYAAEPAANLGNCYRLLGRYDEAEAPLQRSISLFEKHFGPDDARLAIPLASLGDLYTARGQFEQSEPVLERALAIRRTFSDGGRMAAASLGSLGDLYRRTKRYERAEETLAESRRVLLAAGDEPLRLATVLLVSGRLFTEQGKFAEAEPLLRQALSLRQSNLRTRHPLIGSALKQLGAWYAAQGLEEEAKQLEAQAEAIRAEAIAEPIASPSN